MINPIRIRQRCLRSRWDLRPSGKVRVTATPSRGLVGLTPMTPSPAAMNVPRSMVVVALSGMRMVACMLSGSSSDQRVMVPSAAYSRASEQPLLAVLPHGGLVSMTRHMVEGALYTRYTPAPGQLPTLRVSGSMSSGSRRLAGGRSEGCAGCEERPERLPGINCLNCRGPRDRVTRATHENAGQQAEDGGGPAAGPPIAARVSHQMTVEPLDQIRPTQTRCLRWSPAFWRVLMRLRIWPCCGTAGMGRLSVEPWRVKMVWRATDATDSTVQSVSFGGPCVRAVRRNREEAEVDLRNFLVAATAAALAVAVAAGCSGDDRGRFGSASPPAQTMLMSAGSISAVPRPTSTSYNATSGHAPALLTGQVLSSGQGFPVPSIAPPTLLTSVAANSDPNKVDLSWATHGDVLLVTTFGSTSCPRAVEEVIRTGPRSIRLELTAPYAAAHVPPPSGGYPHVCVSDLRPYTSIVEPPTGIEPSNELDVTIDQATYHLPAR